MEVGTRCGRRCWRLSNCIRHGTSTHIQVKTTRLQSQSFFMSAFSEGAPICHDREVFFCRHTSVMLLDAATMLRSPQRKSTAQVEYEYKNNRSVVVQLAEFSPSLTVQYTNCRGNG